MLADEMEDRALVIFVPEDNNDNYRFSLIEITLDTKEDLSRITRNYSNPRRYSYFLGKGIAYYTPNKYLNEKGRVINGDDLRSRFSVEVLTKEFYNELSDWYAWAIKIIRFPNDLNDKTDDDKYNNESAIRLITRLIFVWFLKQRHLIPEEFFDERYIADNLIDGFNPHAMMDLFSKSNESKYYKAILQNLFFAMLNSPITPEGSNELSERHFRKGRSDYDNNKLMRYESYFKNPQLFVDLANRIVPFLNGGLFDCLDEKDKELYYDSFTDRKDVSRYLIVPDYLFFGEEVGKNIDLSEWYGDKKKKKVSARGIIDILKRYNFTVEENTPFDQEVSLDPELLGKVFENLLASYNPETQTTARKQTGSFYTPREIVQYMVNESLVAHLKRTVGKELEPQFRQLMQYTDNPVELSDEQRKSIMQSLYNCKILDPACGSGAFPMGILQQMVHILNRIDPGNTQWRKMMLSKAINETSEAYRTASSDERKDMIADIERSFDENINRPDYARKLYLIENCIYGVDIQPIAIQISKLRFFISLVVDQKTNNNPADNFGIRPLPNLEAKFVAANTLIGLNSGVSITDTDKVCEIKAELKTANHKIFGAKTVKTKRKYKERIKELRISLAEELNVLGFVNEDEAQQLASWDMFNQNTSSSFFDPDWMFGVKDGFDIVIGNPPYVLIPKSEFLKTYSAFYKYQDGKIDLYRLFIERGIGLLKNTGIICYITPNTWLAIKSCTKLRRYVLNECGIAFINDYDESLFTASVNNIVFLLKRNYIADSFKVNLHNKGNIITFDIETDDILSRSECEINVNADDKALEIKRKMLSDSVCLGMIDGIEMCLGVQPYHNSLHTKQQMKEKFLHADYQVNKNYVPEYGGKHFSQFSKLNALTKWVDYSAEFYTKPDKRFFVGPRIIVREIPSKTLICSYIEEFAIFNKSVFNIRSSNMPTKVLLAILNSKAVGYFISAFGDKSKQALFPRLSMKILKAIPIPKIPPKEISFLSSLVDTAITYSDTDSERFQEQVEHINLVVYHLYGLTYDEVLIVDPQTRITREEYEKKCIG